MLLFFPCSSYFHDRYRMFIYENKSHTYGLMRNKFCVIELSLVPRSRPTHTGDNRIYMSSKNWHLVATLLDSCAIFFIFIYCIYAT